MALIEIGSAKQLFVDDYLIESITDGSRVLNRAEKVENNPVLRPERPWEGNHVVVSDVIFDEKDQLFKMWYDAHTYHAGRNDDGSVTVEGLDDYAPRTTCLATSADGVNWKRPSLGLVEFDGSKDNNLLPRDSIMPYMFQDLHDPDPNKRYKGLIREGTTQTPGMTFDLYYSPDALNWTPYENNPVIDTSPRVGRWGPTQFMGWDPIREVYAAHLENCLHRRSPVGKRLIGRAESPDMISWSEPETIIVPDELDTSDTEFYAMPCMAYEGIYVGILWIFHTTDQTHHPTLAFSRDGIHYDRTFREPYIPRGGRADFDNAMITPRTQIVHDGQILTYYNGSNWRSTDTLYELGDRGLRAVGLAVTPLDGFVSIDGKKGVPFNPNPGVLYKDDPLMAQMTPTEFMKVASQGPDTFSQVVTRSFGFTGSRLHVNVQTAGQGGGAGLADVRVQVLTANHEPLPDYSFDDADPVTTTGLAHEVSWNGNADVSSLQGQPIKLRFYIKNAKLYSFQFE